MIALTSTHGAREVAVNDTRRRFRYFGPDTELTPVARLIISEDVAGLERALGRGWELNEPIQVCEHCAALAIELAPDGVRANAVAPVASLTAMTKDTLGSADPKARRRQIEATIPLGRLGEASDIAGVVTFLASPAAAFLTGVCIPIDGGRSI